MHITMTIFKYTNSSKLVGQGFICRPQEEQNKLLVCPEVGLILLCMYYTLTV